ncbi:MAG: hypothetical protein Q7S61_02750 [bacterium]|nr:hypothetical protein [bacterium]
MNIDQLLQFFATGNLFAFFFKSFAILFAFLYLVYAIIVAKQTQILDKTLDAGANGFLFVVSFTQILFGLLLIVLAVLIL